MKLKNIFKKRPNNKELQEKLYSLEKRIFNEKKDHKDLLFYSSPWFDWEPETLEQEISILQDKLDVIAKHFGLMFEETREKEKEWTVKSIKKYKK
jgi:hypothetical protein